MRLVWASCAKRLLVVMKSSLSFGGFCPAERRVFSTALPEDGTRKKRQKKGVFVCEGCQVVCLKRSPLKNGGEMRYVYG
jgi:hypothetical protein